MQERQICIYYNTILMSDLSFEKNVVLFVQHPKIVLLVVLRRYKALTELHCQSGVPMASVY